MRLYHTGDREIREPALHYGRKNADFGQGFYLTPDREFTLRWAGKNAVVNIYELVDSGLKCHTFQRDAAWMDYIFRNRRLQDSLEADVVIGPIANDTIFDTMGIISSGFLRPEEALRLLLIGPTYTQVALKTERALRRLTWIGAERTGGLDHAARQREQQAYQEDFARAMAALDT